MAYTRKRRRSYRRVPKRIRKLRKKATVGTVKRMFNSQIETKWINKTLAINSGYDNSSINVLNSMTQGTTNNTRVGDKIRLKSLDVRFSLTAFAGAADRVRIVVFYDKQPNGAVPPATTIFADGGIFSGTSFFQPFHPDYWPTRYTLIRDKYYDLTQYGGSTNISQEKTVKMRIPLKNRVVQYRAGSNTGNVDDIIKGSLIMFCLADTVVASQPAIGYFATLRFQDA